MKDFTFSMPTNIIFGKQAVSHAGRQMAACGHHVLILYGSDRIEKNGLLKWLTEQLEVEGIKWDIFKGIPQNPMLSVAKMASEVAKEKQVDCLLAVGGGSVIDLAKAVSIGAYNEGELWGYYEKKDVPKRALPFGVVLTMAATASEANCVSVIQNDENGKKLALRSELTRPKFALLNPELTFSVPPLQTAAGAIDAFSHAFERYFHLGQRGTIRNHLCVAVMRTIVEELPGTLADPQNYEGRSQLMWAATMAHSDMIGFDGVFACHAMSHVLTHHYGLSHGQGLAMLMVAWCKYMLAYEAKEMAKFAEDVWKVPAEGRPDIEVAQEGVFCFQNFICDSGLAVTLREAGIVQSNSEKLAKETLGQNECIGENFRRLTQKDVQAIFELARG